MQLKFFHDVKCIIFIIEVLLLSPFINNFFGIILTHPANHDTLCHKSHWKVVVLTVITTTFRWAIARKERTALQHTRSFCRRFTPTKFFACCGAAFFFFGAVPWKFHEPTGRDTDFPSTPLHKQGQELRSEQTVTPLHEQHHLYLFLRLNNSETFVENAFWAQR